MNTLYYDPNCNFCKRISSYILRTLKLQNSIALKSADASKTHFDILNDNNSWVLDYNHKIYLFEDVLIKLFELSDKNFISKVISFKPIKKIANITYKYIGKSRNNFGCNSTCEVITNENKNNYTKTLNITALITLALSFTTFVGFVSGNTIIYRQGQALGFAPLPIPFRQMSSGAETFSFKSNITIYDINGSASQIQESLSSELLKRPHRAFIPFASSIYLMPVVPRSAYLSAHYYLCNYLNAYEIEVNVTYKNQKYSNEISCK